MTPEQLHIHDSIERASQYRDTSRSSGSKQSQVEIKAKIKHQAIWLLYINGYEVKEIAQAFDVTTTRIRQIIDGRRRRIFGTKEPSLFGR